MNHPGKLANSLTVNKANCIVLIIGQRERKKEGRKEKNWMIMKTLHTQLVGGHRSRASRNIATDAYCEKKKL